MYRFFVCPRSDTIFNQRAYFAEQSQVNQSFAEMCGFIFYRRVYGGLKMCRINNNFEEYEISIIYQIVRRTSEMKTVILLDANKQAEIKIR